MGQTVVEKVAQAHMASGPERELQAGDFLTVRPKHVMTHDNTAPVMSKFRTIGASQIRNPKQPVFALDHDIQNRSESNLAKYAAIEEFARQQGVDFYPAGAGIGHQVMCEQLYVTPGAFVVASDSHSNMYGALGAVGTPVVRTDAAAIWATGEFWWQVPRTVQVVLEGSLPAGVNGKDVILALCGLYNHGEVLNAAVEFSGPGVATLDVDARMAIANMTTEWGTLVGWFPADEQTLEFVRTRMGRGVTRVTEEQVTEWEAHPLTPDASATYAGSIRLDLATVTPQVSGPDSVQVTTPLSRMEPIPIQKAYLVSCANSRLGDLEAAAAVLAGKKVADGVKLYIAAASAEVEQNAMAHGAWRDLLAAGAEPLPPGCGPCIGLGAGLLEPGEVGISATNRNFKGRMGSRDARCYLASPAVVAASALAGHIAAVSSMAQDPSLDLADIDSAWQAAPAAAPATESVEILEGFPSTLSGRLVFATRDNLNTDGIYGKDYTYRDDMTPEMMAGVVMENYDPEFAAATQPGDILVGAANFGTGSSREQAATALLAKGFRVIVAETFSQTYLRNAFNNGFPCVACPSLVAALRTRFGSEQKTVIPGEIITIDFAAGAIQLGGETYRFAPLGGVPQALVVAGGVENQVRDILGL